MGILSGSDGLDTTISLVVIRVGMSTGAAEVVIIVIHRLVAIPLGTDSQTSQSLIVVPIGGIIYCMMAMLLEN